MNLTLAGYKLVEVIYEGVRTVIYRARREAELSSVIVKTLKAEYPTLEEITCLRHEYTILRSLNVKGIAKPLSLEKYKNGFALILEDFGQCSLQQLITSEKLPLLSFLSVACQLAETMAELHENHVIHKDIKPQNILVEPENLAVKLIDFSISSRLSRENPTASNPDLLQGTLAYMSPEQTGRMNRSVDYRTDFYSAGITFYEILTGQLPFTTTDPLELVHCHIAKMPVPPHEINAEIPKTVSDIVMKLMAKNAEDRYQSGLGLKADIEICINQVFKGEKIGYFLPGKLDKSGQFLIPQKLYGREKEVASLLEAFDRVAAGTTEMVLVSGYSGIGKTSAVNEIHKPIVRQRGYFTAGKFDQFKKNIPYAALVSALQALMRQLLAESSAQIAVWKEKLSAALGESGQVIIDVIPEVELLVGKQPEVPQLGATETQNRFNRVFQQFIGAIAQKEHPLVLFLDDLQWADSASLKSIELIMTNADSKHLLLIGAYRDNEVSPTHAAIQAIERIQQAGTAVSNIVLQPLDLPNVCQLVGDTLGIGDEPLAVEARNLASLLFHKTAGNPFFLTQLLSTLHQEKLLNFNFSEGRWQWSLQKIQALGIADFNVVELVARNIQKLPDTTQHVVKLAACIGNRFSLDVLAIAFDKSPSETAIALWDALQAGLVLPANDAYKIPLLGEWAADYLQFPISQSEISYKFLHDRVQQAAYTLIPEKNKKATHLKIGRLLLEKTPEAALEENIFDIVNQLNVGANLIARPDEREQLANLNLIAGRKAKAATAYESAVRYLNAGLELLSDSSWRTHYDLTLSLYIQTVEAEYLNTNLEKAAFLSEIVLSKARTLLEKIKIYELKIQSCMSQNQLMKAIETGLAVADMLGVQLSPLPGEGDVPIRLPRLQDLDSLPVMENPYQLAAMRIFLNIAASACVADPATFVQVILTMVNLCIKSGNSALAAFAYADFAMILSGSGDLDSGYHAGQLALRLLEQFNAKELKSKVYAPFNSYTRHWKEPAKSTLPSLLEGIQSGLETGDYEYASICAFHYSNHIFWVGEPLEFIQKQQKYYIRLASQLKQEFSLNVMKTWHQVTLNLEGLSENACSLIGSSFDERSMIPYLVETRNTVTLFYAFVAKTILYYLFKKYDLAVDAAYSALEYAGGIRGMLVFAAHNFYYSLALLAQYPNANLSEKPDYLNQVDIHQKALRGWADSAPFNYQNKYDLVEAEKARVLGQDALAMEYYDRAIKGAAEQGFTHEEAIACELAAEFYFSRDREKVALVYLTDAYYAYIRWGAKAKVKDLEERYADIFDSLRKREIPTVDVNRTTTSITGETTALLDLSTVMKAAQALSGEIILDNLLDKLMHVLIENAGARKAFLFLEKTGELVLAAERDVAEEKLIVMPSVPIDARNDLPLAIVNYVYRTQETVALNDATEEGLFTRDAYILKAQPKSLLSLPLIHRGKCNGILYLENNLTAGAFTEQRCTLLNWLAVQASISLENASLYRELQESEAREREKARALEQSLHKLQQTQSQLVQTEKISSLGQLVAGVAHEVNNPVSFINGNLHHASEYVENTLELVNLYDRHFPNPPAEIRDFAEEIDWEFVKEDLPQMISSMKLGTDRIKDIMQSLRNFSRIDSAEKKAADIHAGIDSTLMILQHRFKAKGEVKAVNVVKEYGKLPHVEHYSSSLNQVFMNIIANALDAMEESRKIGEKEIRIRTEVVGSERAVIRIKDNGPGMAEEVRQRLFDAFFTTKPEGKGTGLGLSISYEIVVEKHGGSIDCRSAPGEGAEFVIAIPI